jgi:hypothetical protein
MSASTGIRVGGDPITGNAARVRRFRKSHRRIDFVPSADVASIVDQQLAAGLDNCLSGVIDRLIRLGHKAIPGNEEATS